MSLEEWVRSPSQRSGSRARCKHLEPDDDDDNDNDDNVDDDEDDDGDDDNDSDGGEDGDDDAHLCAGREERGEYGGLGSPVDGQRTLVAAQSGSSHLIFESFQNLVMSVST